tara:strand:- start:4041 stop:5051 length:1011 start_codon:yes stop_codon:yes gene_type:complete
MTKKIKILITGTAGFIGFHLANKLLKKKINVIGIDNINNYYDIILKKKRNAILLKNKNYKFYKIDISNKGKLNKVFEKNKITYVINLAAQAGVRYSLKEPMKYIQSNLLGFFNVLELSKKYKIKHFLYASTSSVYGINHKLPFMESDDTSHPLQLYAATKKSNELMAHSYSYLFNLPTTGLRFFTVYGPWGRPDMSLFQFTENAISKKHLKIFNYGNHSRDFTYIDDIVLMITSLIKKIPKKNKKRKISASNSTAPYRVVNLSCGKKVKLMNFVREIGKNLNVKLKIQYFPMQLGDIKETLSSKKLIRNIIKCPTPTNYKIGVKKFIDWYKSIYVH